MNSHTYLLLLMILIHKFYMNNGLIASNISIATGNISYVCAFFREKDLSIDDISMPEILTFCSCVVVHKNWVLTARQCFVQLDWYIHVVTSKFTDKLPEKLHKIEEIIDKTELSLVRVSPEFDNKPVDIETTILYENTVCELFGFSTPNGKAIEGVGDDLIYKVWHMQGDLLRINIEALFFLDCKNRYASLSEYKQRISATTLCINPIKNEFFEPCAFDRGAPIICNGKLQGILIDERPLPTNIPLHLPTSCYGSTNNSASIYAEAITDYYAQWIMGIIP